jgi:hypothetical protein
MYLRNSRRRESSFWDGDEWKKRLAEIKSLKSQRKKEEIVGWPAPYVGPVETARRRAPFRLNPIFEHEMPRIGTRRRARRVEIKDSARGARKYKKTTKRKKCRRRTQRRKKPRKTKKRR